MPKQQQIKEKRCTKCDEKKPIAEFSRDRSKPSGYRSSCKACDSIRHRKYKEAGYTPRNPNGKIDNTAGTALCLFVMGKNKWMYQGKRFKHWKASMGTWPPGSIWLHRDKRYIVWGTGKDQYFVELKGE